MYEYKLVDNINDVFGFNRFVNYYIKEGWEYVESFAGIDEDKHNKIFVVLRKKIS